MIELDRKPASAARGASEHDAAQGSWVLLAPERVFKADAIAAEILKRCDGEATFATIADDLARGIHARRASGSMADVVPMLQALGRQAAAGALRLAMRTTRHARPRRSACSPS